MDATPIDFDLARPLADHQRLMKIDSITTRATTALAPTWKAIHEAAATVGAIAGIDRTAIAAELERGLEFEFSQGTANARAPELEDLAEVLQHGIVALLTAHVDGGSSQTAARSLWCEFIVARDRMMQG